MDRKETSLTRKPGMKLFHVSNHLILQITYATVWRRGIAKSQSHELAVYPIPGWKLVCTTVSRATLCISAICRIPHTEKSKQKERWPLGKVH